MSVRIIIRKIRIIIRIKIFTWCQYSATSLRPKDSQIYTRFKISFWKHDPPYPTDAFKNLLPIRTSDPIALAISSISASVCSHKAVIELIEETRCAKNAFATSFDNSDDQRLVVIIFSDGTHCA